MVTSTKSVARKASAIAAAALGVTAPLLGGSAARAATADGASNIFLYRSRDTAPENCTGGTHEISNLGNRALGRYSIYATASFSSSTVGIWLYSRWQQIAATVADKQLWCVGTDLYWQYYAANAYHREVSQVYICSGGCQFIDNFYTAWEPGS
jgi:hypothetical protein